MTEVASGSSALGAPPSRRKQRRKRNPGKKNESSGQQKGGKAPSSKNGSKRSAIGGNNSPPPPHQIKITIRNIQNADKFGSVKSVIEGLISKLMETCVEKKANNQYIIELDRAAVRHLITEEEQVEKRLESMVREREKDIDNEENEGAETFETNNATATDDGDEQMEDTADEQQQTEDTLEYNHANEQKGDAKETKTDELEVIIAPKTVSNLPTIIARPLYVVPPRKTRRRGERGGTAYVLLVAPKIEQKKPVSTTADKKASKANDGQKDEGPLLTDTQSEDQEATTAVVSNTDYGSIPVTANTGGEDGAVVTSNPPEVEINYPRELAKGRLLLSNTIKSLTELAAADSKTQEFAFSGCVVEQSMNGKTWKMFHNASGRPDRRDGTIEGTSDYKVWLENITKQKEELKARPKPLPGGGVNAVTTTAAASEELEEDGQPISSLVAHLRAKKQDAKRKKSQKKKKKEESAKTGRSKTAEIGQSTENGKKKKKKRNDKKSRDKATGEKKNDATATAAAAAKKVKRKKRERAKKKEKGAKVAAAPTALLKPKAAST